MMGMKLSKKQNKRLWTDEQKRILLHAKGKLTLAELAALTGRNEVSVRNQCQHLGIKFKGIK